ncbi:MAG: Fe-S cluster assembly protein SufD [Legionellaceae bacterium]|nr:Fe-S cluster assembly protein SufD [Legionellaceae bacterium]
MTDVLAYYNKQAMAHNTDHSWLSPLRQQGAAELFRGGFPSTRDESWKYTRLDSWLAQTYPEAALAASLPPIQTMPVEAFQVVVNNGQISYDSSLLPEGLQLLSLAEAAATASDWVERHLNHILQPSHGFHALNTAMLAKGVTIHVADNTHISLPLYLLHWQSGDTQAVHLRHLIVLGKNSSLSLIEDYHGAGNCDYYTNVVCEVWLEEGAVFTHTKIQRESKQASHIGHIAVTQNAKSEYRHHSLSIGGKLARSDVQVDFRQQQAHCLLNGIYAAAEGQHLDQQISCRHHVPHCQSEQNYKGIMQGKSRAVFNGTVFVAQDAQKTESRQQNKNLLLSPQAEVDTKPQLEIYADDVICSHGATVGQLDEEALFYLATRGIPAEQARPFLIQAFATENFNRMPNQSLALWMKDLLDRQME